MALEKDKRLLALRHRIVFVLKIFVLVPMALKQRTQHVLPTMLIFVRRVPVDITRLATPALHGQLVHKGSSNQLHQVRRTTVSAINAHNIRTKTIMPLLEPPARRVDIPRRLRELVLQARLSVGFVQPVTAP